jgi:hypothetical protein
MSSRTSTSPRVMPLAAPAATTMISRSFRVVLDLGTAPSALSRVGKLGVFRGSAASSVPGSAARPKLLLIYPTGGATGRGGPLTRPAESRTFPQFR